jgi:hypothetical protein
MASSSFVEERRWNPIHLRSLTSSTRPASKHEIVALDMGLVAGKTRKMLCRIGWYALGKPPEPPSSGCCVFSGVFHHDLDRSGGARHERTGKLG